jgi:endonuclease/exonuclease/phosphatase family metal-dependent hydrolase
VKYSPLRFFLIFITLLSGSGLICTAVAVYLNSSFGSVAAITRFAYPFLLPITFILLLTWLLKKSKWWWFCLLSIGLSFNQLRVLIPIRWKTDFETVKSEKTIRILSWNISRWDERNKVQRGGVSYRPLMMDFIESTGADILCFQEFFECHDPLLFEANIPELKKRGYPYFAFHPSSELFNGKLQYGLAIFSRFPITKSNYLENTKGEHSEGLLIADITVNDTTIRVFNTHLETPGISKSDYTEQGEMKFSKSVLSKLKNSYYLRNVQAERTIDEVKRSPFPVILAADLGDVPNSYAYFTLRSDLQDAFLKKGYGLGTTLRHTSPTLRIDFLFFDQSIRVLQFNNITQIRYSDHYPLLADFQLSLAKLQSLP